jgi:hypothetical protein
MLNNFSCRKTNKACSLADPCNVQPLFHTAKPNKAYRQQIYRFPQRMAKEQIDPDRKFAAEEEEEDQCGRRRLEFVQCSTSFHAAKQTKLTNTKDTKCSFHFTQQQQQKKNNKKTRNNLKSENSPSQWTQTDNQRALQTAREKGDFLSRERDRALNVAGSGRNRGRRRRFAREQQRSPWSSKRGPRLQGLFV